MSELANHLWQSTIFAVAVAVTAMGLRRNSARLRYWLWLAASVKFLIPLSLLVSMGGRVVMPPDAPELPATTVLRVSTYLAPVAVFSTPTPVVGQPHWRTGLGAIWIEGMAAIWFAGSMMLLLRWFRRWRGIHKKAQDARALPIRGRLPVLSSAAVIEPGIFGLFRPVLLLPEGIVDKLTAHQFEAVLAHELCHARRRDNLTAALHMCVETIFWFHPMVWWIGARLVEERERDCDESVLKRGSQPEDYAQGIVNVCKSYIEPPLLCAAGITGADLKKRIREIMTWRGSVPVSLPRKLTLAAAGTAAICVPLAIGIMRAQTLPPAPAYTYDAVSIHRSNPDEHGSRIGPGPQGGMRTQNTTTMMLLTFAYGVRDYQISGAPGWVSSDHFDITFTPDKPEATPKQGIPLKELDAFMSRNRQRTQAVLRDRFGLILRAETHELPIYALTVAKGGPKLTPQEDPKRGPSLQGSKTRITGVGATIAILAGHLSVVLGRPVKDETGLDGRYDFKLEWTPDSPEEPSPEAPITAEAGPSIFTAITEQLGLRLESKKGPVPVYVIEKIDKPSEN
ncbi:MAG TPA: M56 family metallopeptidase [Bryobacteraceae bacterium]|nr:M56 family metallopeptidase [Bryobacteraceae bacterium]